MATLVVYPNGTATVEVPAGQYISVFTEGSGKAKVYQQTGYPNLPSQWVLATGGDVEDEEVLFGPFTYATNVRIEAGCDRVLYNVGTVSVTCSVPVPDVTASDDPYNLTGEAGAQGGAVTVTGGTSSTTTNAGGQLNLTGGTPGATGVGGAVVLTSGAGGSTSGVSGAVTLASGTTTAGSGSATGAVILQSGAGAASAAAVAGGASGAVTVRSQAGGANTGGATGQVGGAAGAVALTGGAGGATNSTGAHAGGAGGAVSVTGGVGGAASAGTGNGGAGGNISLTPGAGGATTGGTAGVPGAVRLVGRVCQYQDAPSAKTTTAALTAAEMLGGIVTGTHSAGSTQTYTMPTGTALDALVQMSVNDSFDWFVINLSAAAADTVTIAGDTGHTIVGNAIVQSVHASTGLIYGSSGHFRTRKTAANTFVTYRIA